MMMPVIVMVSIGLGSSVASERRMGNKFYNPLGDLRVIWFYSRVVFLHQRIAFVLLG